MTLIKEAIQLFKDENFRTFLSKAFVFLIQAYLVGFCYGMLDRLDREKNTGFMILLRKSKFDADTLSLVVQAQEFHTPDDIYVITKDIDKFRQFNAGLIDRLDENDVEYKVAELGTLTFFSYLRNAKYIVSPKIKGLGKYNQFFNNSSRLLVRTYHGLITKGYGNLRTENIQKMRGSENFELAKYPGDFDFHSVASEVEQFYRAVAEGRHPVKFRKYGYPRFDRIQDLQGIEDPLIPRKSEQNLDDPDPKYRVLYAPTHKDASDTTLFPFDDFDPERLLSCLEETEIQLYVRMHPNEEESGKYDPIIDGENIRYAGQSFSPSVIELLPHIDVLITDYSAIYMEFLLFDRPIIFVKDDLQGFLKNRGIAFDYDVYFPGRKVDKFSEFITHLQRCAEYGDDFSENRKIVRKVFNLNEGQNFMRRLQEHD